MPFTPFHMGPALALKAVAGPRFSVLMFGLAQVAMDIEPGIGLAAGWDVLHGWTHTYAGAAAIGVAVLATGRPVASWILRRWNDELAFHRLGWLASPPVLGWWPAATGTFIGTFSHVLLDSLMHADMRPLAPFAPGNALLSAVSLGTLHAACVAAGLAGIAAWIVAGALRRRRPPR